MVRHSQGEWSDAELVHRARAGEPAAFELLVRRYLDSALVAARRLLNNPADAEDAVQDAFIRALERLDDCKDPARFGGWLLTIVRNRAHNLRDYERVRDTESLEEHWTHGTRDTRPAERRELSERLQGALGALTELQRTVVLLHDYEGFKHREIGDRLGISAGASRFNLHAARKKLRSLLGEYAPNGTDSGGTGTPVGNRP